MTTCVLLFLLFVCAGQCLGQTVSLSGQFPAVQGELADDSLRMLASQVVSYARNTPQEIVSVHMDNNCYFLGDTIWYKAYVLRDGKMTPSDISCVLYAELFNQDGYLVERQQVELRNGQAHGSFLLPDSLYSGYYELRAYTRWMLNWGITDHPHTKMAEQWFITRSYARDYYIDYEKLYSRTFPVYDKPKQEGAFEHNMTLRPLRKRIRSNGTDPDLELAVYPEGGNLVAGLPCRIAWEGNTDEGLHKDGTLVVTDQNGQQVATSKTESRGRGTFSFTPQQGMTYTAQFTAGNQTAKVKLPKAQSDGCAIQVEQDGNKVSISLACAGLVLHSIDASVASISSISPWHRIWKSLLPRRAYSKPSRNALPKKVATGMTQVWLLT